LGPFPFCLANAPALREYLFHQIIAGESAARAAPIFWTRRTPLIREQIAD
jgi:hypothetical protein